MPAYRMDDATWQHLTDYCQRETHTEDEAQELRDRMVEHLEALEEDDAEYSISHGWTHVRNLLWT